jgi:hypothetical protein
MYQLFFILVFFTNPETKQVSRKLQVTTPTFTASSHVQNCVLLIPRLNVSLTWQQQVKTNNRALISLTVRLTKITSLQELPENLSLALLRLEGRLILIAIDILFE